MSTDVNEHVQLSMAPTGQTLVIMIRSDKYARHGEDGAQIAKGAIERGALCVTVRRNFHETCRISAKGWYLDY